MGQHSFRRQPADTVMTNGQCPHRLIVAALLHGMGEPKTGDLPSPVRWGCPRKCRTSWKRIEHRALRASPYADLDASEEEGRLRKLADKIDGL